MFMYMYMLYMYHTRKVVPRYFPKGQESIDIGSYDIREKTTVAKSPYILLIAHVHVLVLRLLATCTLLFSNVRQDYVF